MKGRENSVELAASMKQDIRALTLLLQSESYRTNLQRHSLIPGPTHAV